MAPQTGMLDLAALRAVRYQSAAEYGLTTIQQVLEADVAAHNAIVLEMVQELCEPTTDRQRIYGTSADGDMQEIDEFGRAESQRTLPGATCGFPLRSFQYAIGWTEKWFLAHTPAEMAEQVLASQKAHLRAIQREVRKAVFLATNYDFTDFLVDKVSLPVKRFVNADGAGIPNGPNGEAFDGATHTHFLASATLTATWLLSLVDHVVEHGHGGMIKLAINKTNEAAVRALSGFVAYPDPRIIYRNADTPGQTLDLSRLDNRAIGVFGAAEVWVKPWVPANYYFAWDAADPQKPLAFRQRAAAGLQGLRVAATLTAYPLVAQYMEAEFGVGVWTRTNGAVGYVGDTSYADPTIS